MALSTRYLTENEIDEMAHAALDSYEMTGDKAAAFRAAREHAADEMGVRATQAQCATAFQRAMVGWTARVARVKARVGA
jgi:hypothetical protein